MSGLATSALESVGNARPRSGLVSYGAQVLCQVCVKLGSVVPCLRKTKSQMFWLIMELFRMYLGRKCAFIPHRWLSGWKAVHNHGGH